MTYHILIIVSVIVRLSRVGVAVSDEVLHSTAERARDCGRMRHTIYLSITAIKPDFVCRSLVFISTSRLYQAFPLAVVTYQLWGRHQAVGPECRRSRADCRGDWLQGRSGSPRMTPTAPSAL